MKRTLDSWFEELEQHHEVALDGRQTQCLFILGLKEHYDLMDGKDPYDLGSVTPEELEEALEKHGKKLDNDSPVTPEGKLRLPDPFNAIDALSEAIGHRLPTNITAHLLGNIMESKEEIVIWCVYFWWKEIKTGEKCLLKDITQTLMLGKPSQSFFKAMYEDSILPDGTSSFFDREMLKYDLNILE